MPAKNWPIGAAPISFAVFGDIALPVERDDLLANIADAGYGGTELGPPGFFGRESELPSRLDAVGLEAIGAYVPLHLTGPKETFEQDLEQLSRTQRELQLCQRFGAPRGSPGPFAIFADEGDEALISQPFRGPEPSLGDRAWPLALERLATAGLLADRAGIAVSFHPHFGTTWKRRVRSIDDSRPPISDSASTRITSCRVVQIRSTISCDTASGSTLFTSRMSRSTFSSIRRHDGFQPIIRGGTPCVSLWVKAT